METKFRIGGMTCEHCVKAVQSALHRVAGTDKVVVQIGDALVWSETPPSREAVQKALEEEGYELLL